VLLASLVRCRTGTQTRACAVEFKQGASLDVDAAFESSESPRKMGHLEKERQAEMAHETRHADSKEELHRLLQCLALQMEACSEIIQIAQHRTISQLACRCFAMWAHFLQQQTLQTETTFEKQRFHHVRVMQRARLEGFFETSRCRIVGDLEYRCFAVWLHVSKQRMLISRLEPVVEVAHRNMVSELACRCFGVWAYHTRQKILSMQAMADLDQHKETILQHKAEIDQHKAEVDRHKERERQLRDASYWTRAGLSQICLRQTWTVKKRGGVSFMALCSRAMSRQCAWCQPSRIATMAYIFCWGMSSYRRWGVGLHGFLSNVASDHSGTMLPWMRSMFGVRRRNSV